MTVTAVASPLRQPKIAEAYAFASVLTPVDGSIIANGPFMAVYCGGSGDLTVTPANTTATITFKRVPAGTIIPLQIQGVQSTATTATDIVGLG